MAPTATDKKRVVIIGASYAGIHAALNLDKAKSVTVTLIDVKDTFYVNMASVRAVVQEQLIPRVFIPLNEVFKNKENTFKQAKVETITKDTVVLASGESVPYDILIAATGSSYAAPFKLDYTAVDQGKAQIANVAAKIKDAENVLIVGAGPVGVELAGEIAAHYPTKKVTLVGDKLVAGPYSDAFRTKLLAKIRALGINIHLDDRINKPDDFDPFTKKTLTSTKGVAFESDIQLFVTGGGKANSDAFATLSPSLIDEKGYVKVHPTMQSSVAEFANVFAAGDVAGLNVPKLAYLSGQQGDLVAKNVLAHIAGKKLKEFSPPPPVIFVTLGPKGGAGQTPLGTVGDIIVRTIKGKDFFVPQTWKDVAPVAFKKLPKN